MSGVSSQVPPPNQPIGMANEQPVIADRNWWRFFFALSPRNKTGTAGAPNGSVLYETQNGITGDGSLVYSPSTLTFTSGSIALASGGTIVETQGGTTYDYLGNTPAPTTVPQTVTAAAGTTLSGANFMGGVLLRTGPAGPFTDTTPSQTQIRAATQQAIIGIGLRALTLYGQPLLLINGTTSAWTIAPGTNVQFFGNTSGGDFVIPANTSRPCFLVVTDGNSSPAHSQLWA